MSSEEASFERNLMQAPFLVAILRGPERIIELANPQMLRAWGVGPEIIGLPLLLATPEFQEQPFRGYLDEVFRTGISYEGREELARLPNPSSGELEDRYFDIAYGALRNESGVVDGILVSAFEVTTHVLARQRLERALEEARQERQRAALLVTSLSATMEMLNSAQQAANIGIFDWDLSSDSLSWSPELYRLMGLAPGSIKASTAAWDAVVVEEDGERGWDTFERAAAARSDTMEVEVRLKQPAGGVRWVRLSSQIEYDAAGSACRVLGAAVDIQALKQAAAARASALEEAQRGSRAKDEFLATMSRELRSPLHSVLGWAAILQSDHVDRGRLDRGLSVIERSARAQSRIVGDLLDVSRIISGKLRLDLSNLNPATAILAAVEEVRQSAETKGVALHVEVDDDLGVLAADAERLQQVVWNLLANAVKFTPAGGTVTVQADRLKSVLVLSVEDTGPGISAEELPTLFNRLLQVDAAAARPEGGLGIGLALVRYVVEAHGGSVFAHSAGLGLGATFTVSLPGHSLPPPELSNHTLPVAMGNLSHGPSSSPSSSSPSSSSPSSSSRLNGCRLLIVDDNKDLLDVLQLLLQHAGATVTAVPNAALALQLTALQEFDALISDLGMPEMNGYELMRRLRCRHTAADLPAIALSSYASEEDTQQALNAGYQEHLIKPTDTTVLVRTLLTLLQKSR